MAKRWLPLLLAVLLCLSLLPVGAMASEEEAPVLQEEDGFSEFIDSNELEQDILDEAEQSVLQYEEYDFDEAEAKEVLLYDVEIDECCTENEVEDAPVELDGAASVSVSFARKNHSYWGGTSLNNAFVNCYYDLATVSGSSDVATRINTSLQYEYKTFLNAGYTGSLNNNGFNRGTLNYWNAMRGEVAQNGGGYLSLRYEKIWDMGGVGDGSYYGLTYSLVSGSRLYLSDLTTTNGGKITHQMISDALVRWKGISNIDFNSNQLTDYLNQSLAEFNFYLENNQVILCVAKYQLLPGIYGHYEIPTGIYCQSLSSSGTGSSTASGTNGWVQSGGSYYYYKDGVKQTGWLSNNGTYYYLGTSGAMQTGWIQIGSKWFYFKSNGAAATGWNKINGKWYYMNVNGRAYTGLQNIGGSLYYFHTSSCAMQTGWQYVNTSGYYWLYFMTDGSAKENGWEKINGYWYYFKNYKYYSGAIYTIDDKQYCFNDGGRMVTGWVHVYDENGDWIGWAYFMPAGWRIWSGTGYIDGVRRTFEEGYLV